jgi:hypothetical protein
MPFPYSVSLTLVHRVLDGQDSFGNDAYRDETETVAGSVAAPGGSSEDTQFTEQVSTSMTFYLPYGTPVGPLDAIIYNGTKYEVQGEPSSYSSPFSNNTAPVEVRARAITGAST